MNARSLINKTDSAGPPCRSRSPRSALQRNDALLSGESDRRRDKQLLLSHRATLEPGKGPLTSASRSGSEISAFVEPPFGHDFRHLRVHAGATHGEAANFQFLPAAPSSKAKDVSPSPGPLTQPGVTDFYISVRSPTTISRESILARSPLDAPSSGLSFQLSRDAKFKQEEYIVGRLSWKPPGSKLPESQWEEEYSRFTHAWESETEKRPDLPGIPILLKAFDTHTYGLAVRPGYSCETAAKEHPTGFSRDHDDWSFSEYAMFIDTVTFSDKQIRRKYFFDFLSRKEGNQITASLHYSNVDKVETI